MHFLLMRDKGMDLAYGQIIQGGSRGSMRASRQGEKNYIVMLLLRD